jgi:hypothetical protein
VGVFDVALGVDYGRASGHRANYPERCLVSDALSGSETNLDLAGRIAVLPVRADRIDATKRSGFLKGELL